MARARSRGNSPELGTGRGGYSGTGLSEWTRNSAHGSADSTKPKPLALRTVGDQFKYTRDSLERLEAKLPAVTNEDARRSLIGRIEATRRRLAVL